MYFYTDNDELEDWGICDQSDHYPKTFTSYTQAVEELGKDPLTLVLEQVNQIDERYGHVEIIYIVRRM